jgi:hypothetical protein
MVEAGRKSYPFTTNSLTRPGCAGQAFSGVAGLWEGSSSHGFVFGRETPKLLDESDVRESVCIRMLDILRRDAAAKLSCVYGYGGSVCPA